MSKKKNILYYLLNIITIIGVVLLPFAIVKRSFKDWVIVYLVSFIGNHFADSYLVTKGYIKYKNKIFKNIKIHLPFDYIHYPLLLLYYNQWTLNSRPIGVFLKAIILTTPQIILEILAEKKTKLIKWKKGWRWYHSFLSMVLKLIICRSIIAIIRIINRGKISV